MKRDVLIELRREKELTQAELAKNLGISTVYVRKIENGDADPGRKTMIKYQNFFKENADKLFPDLFFEFNDKKFINNNSA